MGTTSLPLPPASQVPGVGSSPKSSLRSVLLLLVNAWADSSEMRQLSYVLPEVWPKPSTRNPKAFSRLVCFTQKVSFTPLHVTPTIGKGLTGTWKSGSCVYYTTVHTKPSTELFEGRSFITVLNTSHLLNQANFYRVVAFNLLGD